jgi:hypothetical protein
MFNANMAFNSTRDYKINVDMRQLTIVLSTNLEGFRKGENHRNRPRSEVFRLKRKIK